MDLLSAATLAGVGLAGGFMAGFLGIGGGVIMIPLLVYAVGTTMSLATGISVVQAFFATLSGLVIHRRNRTVDMRLGLVLGASGVLGALVGSFGSAYLDNRTLQSVYLLLLGIAAILIFFAPRKENTNGEEVKLWVAFPIGLGVGVLAGILGVGGGFIMIPIMIAILRVPTRIAIGTSLIVVLMTTVAGATGKIATGQFDPQIALFVVIGSIAGAQVGGRVNSRVTPRVLRVSLGLLLVAIALRTGIDLLGVGRI